MRETASGMRPLSRSWDTSMPCAFLSASNSPGSRAPRGLRSEIGSSSRSGDGRPSRSSGALTHERRPGPSRRWPSCPFSNLSASGPSSAPCQRKMPGSACVGAAGMTAAIGMLIGQRTGANAGARSDAGSSPGTVALTGGHVIAPVWWLESESSEVLGQRAPSVCRARPGGSWRGPPLRRRGATPRRSVRRCFLHPPWLLWNVDYALKHQ